LKITTRRDPIAVEIIRNALEAIAEEMGIAVVRGGYSTFIKEGADASSAILDAQGQLVAQSLTTNPLHTCSLRECIKEVLLDYPAQGMREGDVYLTNDPHRGGVHSNDIAVLRPVFVGGKVAFFTATLVHVADLGGVSAGGLPGQATEIYHEGLLLPPLPIYRAGAANQEVEKIIRLNSRTPEKVMGDIRALIAGCNVGAERLGVLLDRYGMDTLRQVIGDVLDYAEELTRQQIQKFSETPATGEFLIDDDGIDLERAYRVKVTLTRRGTDLEIDLTGTDAQARGAINAAYSQAMTGAIFGVRSFFDPNIPVNEGMFRPLKVILPPGTIVNPGPSAAVNARIVTVTAIIEAVVAAVTSRRPEPGIAGNAILGMQMLSGRLLETGRYWIAMDLDFGGLGARSDRDGVDASNRWGGRATISQLEALEAEFPVRFEGHRLLPDSGGPGRWRGGLAVERKIRFLADSEVAVRTDRIRFPPPGRAGGEPGRPGAWFINRGEASEVRLRSKQMRVPLAKDDVLTLLTSGGGGYGPPLQRDPAWVRADAVAGKVSMAHALEAYGVVLHPQTLEVDVAATERLRANETGASR
jgi:N-methylhydantoinase B